MPDITQLPKLASYYDVTIDDLMGYEAQLSTEDIKKAYERFASDFASKPFDEVLEAVRDFIRQYYSCYEALVQVVVLMLNHYDLTETEKQQEILAEMVGICERVQEKCADASMCTEATILQAMIELIRGNPQITIDKLKPFQSPRSIKDGSEGILVQAYQMTGQIDEAMEWNQVLMYSHLLSLVENSIFYLMSNLNDKDIGLATIERVSNVAKSYELDKLHSNSFLQFKYAEAMFYAIQGMTEEAIKAIEIFVNIAKDFVDNGLYLHGDGYFDRLDNYFMKVEDYMITPRNKETVKTSIAQNLENPVFEKLYELEEFKKIKRSAEEWNS